MGGLSRTRSRVVRRTPGGRIRKRLGFGEKRSQDMSFAQRALCGSWVPTSEL